MGQLEGQVAVVTGGGGGIARGIATRFGREGAQVAIVDADKAAAEATATAVKAAGGRCGVWVANLLAAGEAERVMSAIAAEHGGIDVLVNAGQAIPPVRAFAEKPIDDLQATLNAGPVAAARAMKAAYPHLKARGGGRVINVGSFYGAMATAGVADAVASDGALAAMTRAVGVEWAPDRILVNYLQSGSADIPEFHAWRQAHGQGVQHRIENLAIPRLADPVEDIGGGAMFLASDEANFIVGHKVFADGGQHLNASVFDARAAVLSGQA